MFRIKISIPTLILLKIGVCISSVLNEDIFSFQGVKSRDDSDGFNNIKHVYHTDRSQSVESRDDSDGFNNIEHVYNADKSKRIKMAYKNHNEKFDYLSSITYSEEEFPNWKDIQRETKINKACSTAFKSSNEDKSSLELVKSSIPDYFIREYFENGNQGSRKLILLIKGFETEQAISQNIFKTCSTALKDVIPEIGQLSEQYKISEDIALIILDTNFIFNENNMTEKH
jgi:hypothetical protein